MGGVIGRKGKQWEGFESKVGEEVCVWFEAHPNEKWFL